MEWHHNMNHNYFEKICCFSHLNSWWNILNLFRKSHAVMRMKVNFDKGSCPNVSRNCLDGCRDDHNELPLVYPSMNIPPCQLQELPYLILVLILLEFIIGFIESACSSLLIPIPDTLLCICFEAFSDIDVIIEFIRCEEGTKLWEVTNHLQGIWRDRDV